MSQSEFLPSPTDAFTNGNDEPIHIPGAIQPHGLLFVLQKPHLEIIKVSNNTFEILGIHPQETLNKTIENFLEPEQIQLIEQGILEGFELINPLTVSIKTKKGKHFFNGIAHFTNQFLVLELEPFIFKYSSNVLSFYHLVKAPITRIQKSQNLRELCQVIVEEIRKLTEFDRVMLYQFDTEGAGEVVAEAKRESVNSLLGLHYPAIDIPPLARQLFTQNILRFIPDLNYQPVEFISRQDLGAEQPLDLSLSVLRSVSPCHIQYLKNMGVAASMAISLIREQQLWGLIACHNQTPKYISYDVRNSCEILGKFMVSEIDSKVENENLEYQNKLKLIQTQLLENISQVNSFTNSLLQRKDKLLELVSAQGAVVCINEDLTFIGKTPDLVDIQNLVVWLESRLNNYIFYTDYLPKIYPAAEKFKEAASGLLAVSISKMPKHYILWFRQEVIQTVDWAGNPHQSVEIEPDGSLYLSPRNSFELWQETVRLKSLPWKPCEIEIVLELRVAMLGLELLQLNEELEGRVHQRTQELERSQVALRQQVERERLMIAIAQQIRQSLDLREILSTTVREVQKLLAADRVVVYRVWPDGTGSVIAEAAVSEWTTVVGLSFSEEHCPESTRQRFTQGRIYTLSDVEQEDIFPCLAEFLKQIQVKAELVVPIVQQDNLWGLLIAHQCTQPRQWQTWETDLLVQLANQMAIATQQSELYQKLQEELRERQRAEQALRQSENLFRSLSESSPVGIFRTDAQGKYIYTNPRCQSICGFTFEQALGDGWRRFAHPDDLASFLAQWSASASGNQEFCGELRYVYRDGTICFCRVRTVLMLSMEGELIGHVGTVEDITESRAIEKMKSEFISIVSHELRTPLAAIRGSLGLLAAGVLKNQPEIAQQMLNIASSDTERLVRLVNDILDLERLESQKINLVKQWCDGATLMHQSVETVQSLATDNQITLSIEPTTVQIWADSDRIIQTLVNLLSNAIKFSPAQSTVTLSVQALADRVLFQVKDQGRGIPPDKLETIFGRFQQVDASDSRQKGGTGLGLAICRSIVQQHGGRIWAESVLEQGSVFSFTLPIPLD